MVLSKYKLLHKQEKETAVLTGAQKMLRLHYYLISSFTSDLRCTELYKCRCNICTEKL